MKIWFWLKNSRLFSLPMTVLSWLIVFLYTIGGDTLNGFLALLGISCAHLGTNLFDDYVDYKKINDNCQKSKCAYIKNGLATIEDVLKVVIIYFSIASIIGLILLIRCGLNVLWLGLLGGLIALFYSKLSERGFSEIAVGLAFGPLLFEGVYFVMKGKFSLEVLIMSLAVVMFTIGLMYVHTVLDFEGDIISGKKTLSSRLKNKQKAIDGVFFVYGLGFIFTIIAIFMLKNYFLFLTFLLIPYIKNLHDSLETFKCGDDVRDFYFRLLKARNIMVIYSVIFALSIVLNM